MSECSHPLVPAPSRPLLQGPAVEASPPGGVDKPEGRVLFPEFRQLVIGVRADEVRVYLHSLVEPKQVDPDQPKAQRKSHYAERPYVKNVLHFDPCAYCGARDARSIDHIEPHTSYGSSNWQNLSAACASCNRGKGEKSLLLWLLEDKRLQQRRLSNDPLTLKLRRKRRNQARKARRSERAAERAHAHSSNQLEQA